MEEIIKVGHDGFVRLIDTMGTDSSICQAARISYGDGTKSISSDRHLIRYLMRHRHTSPFEMVELKFHVRVPMDIWRQWIRHRTANVNEYSTRYSLAIDSVVKTKSDEWRIQSKDNKQGSSDKILDPKHEGNYLTYKETKLHELAKEVYYERLEHGVARELARKDLPLSTYTEAYWKCDLHNIFHFLKLRMEKHAQKEIREYANAIAYYVKEKFPIAYEAFEDYLLNSITLTHIDTLLYMAHKQYNGDVGKILNDPMYEKIHDLLKLNNNQKKRELLEFIEKMAMLDELIIFSFPDFELYI